MTIIPFLYSSNEDLKEIQQIITFIKIANMAKQVTDQITDRLMIAKKKVIDSRQ